MDPAEPGPADGPGNKPGSAVTRPALVLVRAGGAAGIVAALVIVALFALQFVLPAPPPDSSAAAELRHLAENQSVLRLANGLYPVMHLALLVFFLGLYQWLLPAGGFARLGLVAGVLGLLLFFLTVVIYDGRLTLASEYAAADEATRAALLATLAGVERVQHVVSVAGHVLAWGVGVSSLSAVAIRTSVLSRWTGWGGLAFGLLAWLYALRLADPAFGPLLLVLNLFAIVWLVPTGLSMLRLDPDAAVGVERSASPPSDGEAAPDSTAR